MITDVKMYYTKHTPAKAQSEWQICDVTYHSVTLVLFSFPEGGLPLLVEVLKSATFTHRSEISFSLLLFSSSYAVCSSIIWETNRFVLLVCFQ